MEGNKVIIQNETIYNTILCDIPINKNTVFDIEIYKKYNNDLKDLSNEELIKHYNYYGKFEN